MEYTKINSFCSIYIPDSGLTGKKESVLIGKKENV